MPSETTWLEYGWMSDLAYDKQDEISEIYFSKLSGMRGRGWHLVAAQSGESIRQGKGGYQGIVFRHDIRKEIVVAHCGTKLKNSGAVEADIRMVMNNYLHPQIQSALQVTLDEGVRGYLGNGYRLTFTGHSLGGFLSTVSLYCCQREDLGEYYYPKSKAVVFDPAGSRSFIEALEPSGDLARRPIQDKRQLDIIHLVSYPNYVNAWHPHVGGSLYWLKPETRVVQAGLDSDNPITYLEATHSLRNILDAFNEQTGYPEVRNCELMVDWPVVDLSTLKGLTHPEEWLGSALHFISSLADSVMDRTETQVPYVKELMGGNQYQLALRKAAEETRAARGEEGNLRSGNSGSSTGQMMSQLASHHSALPGAYNKRMSLVHFDREVADFLVAYDKFIRGTEGLEGKFFHEYKLNEGEKSLLRDYRLNQHGEVVLSSNSNIASASSSMTVHEERALTVFAFREALSELTENHTEILGIQRFKERLTITEQNVLEEKISALEKEVNEEKRKEDPLVYFFKRRIVAPFAAIASADKAKADAELNLRRTEFSEILRASTTEAREESGAHYFPGSAVSLTPGGEAKVKVNVKAGEGEEVEKEIAEASSESGPSTGPK